MSLTFQNKLCLCYIVCKYDWKNYICSEFVNDIIMIFFCFLLENINKTL